jgi:hypothetical protein
LGGINKRATQCVSGYLGGLYGAFVDACQLLAFSSGVIDLIASPHCGGLRSGVPDLASREGVVVQLLCVSLFAANAGLGRCLGRYTQRDGASEVVGE